jgi:hypothetical protein
MAGLEIKSLSSGGMGSASIWPLSDLTILAPYRYWIVVDFPHPVEPNIRIMVLFLMISEFLSQMLIKLKN